MTKQTNNIQWSTSGYSTTGAISTSFGTGNANTNSIVSNQGDANYAAKLCYDLILNGYSDWYLPTKDELDKLFNKGAGVSIAHFQSSYYWTSSESSSGYAWIQSFGNGDQSITDKHSFKSVRAVRSF